MPQGSSHPGQPLTLLWMGLLTGVIMVAGAMSWLPYHAAPGFPGGSLWWLAILLPIAPAWLFRQRAHALEQAWRQHTVIVLEGLEGEGAAVDARPPIPAGRKSLTVIN